MGIIHIHSVIYFLECQAWVWRKYQAADHTAYTQWFPITRREGVLYPLVLWPALQWSRSMDRGRNDQNNPCLMSSLC